MKGYFVGYERVEGASLVLWSFMGSDFLCFMCGIVIQCNKMCSNWETVDILESFYVSLRLCAPMMQFMMAWW